jgi:hypothetical protein
LGTFVAAGSPAAILDPRSGRTSVVARGTDNEIYASWETGQATGAFGGWNLVPLGSDPAASDPTVALLNNSNGQSWFILFRNRNDVNRVYWHDPNTVPTAAAPDAVVKEGPKFVPYSLPVPPAG